MEAPLSQISDRLPGSNSSSISSVILYSKSILSPSESSQFNWFSWGPPPVLLGEVPGETCLPSFVHSLLYFLGSPVGLPGPYQNIQVKAFLANAICVSGQLIWRFSASNRYFHSLFKVAVIAIQFKISCLIWAKSWDSWNYHREMFYLRDEDWWRTIMCNLNGIFFFIAFLS